VGDGVCVFRDGTAFLSGRFNIRTSQRWRVF